MAITLPPMLTILSNYLLGVETDCQMTYCKVDYDQFQIIFWTTRSLPFLACKVEIGSKLLHHFREVPDCQTLATTALSSSQESGALEIMAGVVNIFYLLAGFTYVHDHMRGTRQDNTQESDCKHIYHASVPLDRYLGLLQALCTIVAAHFCIRFQTHLNSSIGLSQSKSATSSIWLGSCCMQTQCKLKRFGYPYSKQLELHFLTVDRQPSVVQIILSGIRGCNPKVVLSPHLVRYLGKHILLGIYCYWKPPGSHNKNQHHHPESICVVAGEALAQLYAELGETDIFYDLFYLFSQTAKVYVLRLMQPCHLSSVRTSVMSTLASATSTWVEIHFTLDLEELLLIAPKFIQELQNFSTEEVKLAECSQNSGRCNRSKSNEDTYSGKERKLRASVDSGADLC
ncbi:hypothetical protein VP01_891g2 [Puccinia sorghi]|uniref:Uncharacterized protein n=1 Tax=Puccinia sorghi TaxID=27349 RepID=A0A0L6U815_9BASI|nr:hypothetical protein VP01_891g2 [Puccinia sorghi]